jgi:hypothetical protein
MQRRARTFLALTAVLVGVGTLLVTPPVGATTGSQDPPLTVDDATLDAALHCSTPFDDTREPVLLVHGTFANDDENYGWNYRPHLIAAGFDVCTVTLPNRSLDDIQVSSEYVVNAVRDMAAMSGGRKIDLLGHSQGGLQPRWATRFFPETRALIDDVVTLAAPHHGTAVASLPGLGCGACFQMGPDSGFISALNSGDESPGDVDYTSIFTETVDELVTPQPAASTIAPADNVANISIQAACSPIPKLVDHVTIVADAAVYDLVLDAFDDDGPANVARAQPDCLTPFFPTLQELAEGQSALENLLETPTVPEGSVVTEEPPLTFYADPARPAFTDVPSRHWAYWEIEWAAHRGIATGTGLKFSPKAAWNRAQAVMWLWRLAGRPEGAPDTTYTDVPASAWYHDGLDWATDEGVVLGFANDTFRPRGNVNRAQLAWWLWSYAEQPTGSPDHPFTDVPDGAWYEDGLDWVAATGIVTGYPGPTFRPSAVLNRASATGLLLRLDRLVAT